MSALKPPLACNHIPAAPGWFYVVDEERPDGTISLYREPVIAWRLETFAIEKAHGECFDQLTPVLASGSVSESTGYVLQFGKAYFSGNWRFDGDAAVIEYFKRLRGK